MNTRTAPDIDWTKIRDIDDCILPKGFRDGEGEFLGHIAHGSRVVDRDGQRFLVMGHGSVQGTVILRDRYRRMFHQDIDTRVKLA